MLVRKIFLVDASPSLRSAFIDAAEWDVANGVLRVGDLVVPVSACKEFHVVPQPPAPPPAPAPAPEPAKPPPIPGRAKKP